MVFSKRFCGVVLLFLLFSFVEPVPGVWQKVQRADAKEVLQLTFALHQNDKVLHDLFAAIAFPDGRSYREFLELQHLTQLIGPESHIVSLIHEYLVSIGASDIKWTVGKEYVQFCLFVSQAELAWNSHFFTFRHQSSNRIIIRTDEKAQIPHQIAQYLELTLGLYDFFDTKKERRMVTKEEPKNKGEAATNTAPYILTVTGSDTDVNVYFYAVCKNGIISKNPTHPCSDQGPEVYEFIISIEPQEYSKTGTRAKPRCSLVGGQTVCMARASVPPYSRCRILTQTYFTDNTTSQIYEYPTLYSPTIYITPQVIYETYNIPRGTRGSSSQNSQAIVSFEEQYYSHQDLKRFFDATGLLQQEPILIGYNNDSMPGGEATLDVQWIMGVGQGIPTTTWSFPVGDYILNWAIAVANTTNPPLVTSISYGDTEIGYEQKSGYGLQYIYRMDAEFMKMSVRGLTVIAGSGDAGWSNVGEMGNDLSAPDTSCVPGRAFYPSVSPYVMSLSATFLTTNALSLCGQQITGIPGNNDLSVPIVCNTKAAEVGVSVSQGISWTTGGGFSNVTMRHQYQNEAVEYFLTTSTHLPPSSYWNSQGQGYADIATIGWNQLVVWEGIFFPIGGTSASGPVAAGLFALINDALLNAGKQPLGFINPLLYEWAKEHPSSFFDVTVGKNNDGDIQPPGSPYPTFCEYGFTAQPGWDPVSGLGSPNFQMLRFLALQHL